MPSTKIKQSNHDKIEWVRLNYMTDPDKCLTILAKIESEDPFIIANKYNMIGLIRFWRSEYLTALDQFKKAISLSKSHDFKELETKILVNISCLYIRFKRYNIALEYAFDSLKYKFDRLNSMTYNNLALIYSALGNEEKQLEYQMKAKSLNEKSGEKRMVVTDLRNIAENYTKQKRHKEALSTYLESLEVVEKYNFNTLLGYTYSNIAFAYISLENYEQALAYSTKSVDYSIKYKSPDSLVNGSLAKATAYFYLDQLAPALEALEHTFSAITGGMRKIYQDAYELKIKIISKLSPEKIAESYEEYVVFLKSDLNEIDNKNDLEDILKFREQEIEGYQKKNAAIELQNRELEVVSKLLAHDLKTPTRTVGSFSGLLNKKLESSEDPAIRECLDFISSGAHEMYQKLDITEQYLNFKLSKNKSQVDLNRIIETVVRLFDKDTVSIEVEHELPFIFADQMAIRRMFELLFRFIFKYNEETIKRIKIRHKSDVNDELFIVTDNGKAITYARFWFKEFFQSDLIASGKIEMGFAFVRKIINLHGGHLLIDEEEDGTTVLKIWFPKKEDKLNGEQP